MGVIDAENVSASEGIYRIRQMFGPIVVSSGVGVFWKGCMHTKAHVTGDVPLLVHQNDSEMNFLEPSYYNETPDLIVWGGPPRMCKIGNDQRVVAVIIDDYNRKHIVNSLVQESAPVKPILLVWQTWHFGMSDIDEEKCRRGRPCRANRSEHTGSMNLHVEECLPSRKVGSASN